jgi:hypothetical protein
MCMNDSSGHVLTLMQDTITHEDARFRAYLEAEGYDTGSMGITESH